MTISGELVPMEAESPDLSTLTLDQLHDVAISEHGAVVASVEEADAHLSSAVIHGIAAGEALLELQRRRGRSGGDWLVWVKEQVEIPGGMISHYMRWALYKDHILNSAVPLTTSTVQSFVRGLPRRPDARSPDANMAAEISRLHAQGLSYRAIADVVGVSRGCVQSQIDPGWRKEMAARRRRTAAARSALKESERRAARDATAKTGTENQRAIYSRIRDAATRADREGLTDLVRTLHKAEDQILEAIDRSEHGRNQ